MGTKSSTKLSQNVVPDLYPKLPAEESTSSTSSEKPAISRDQPEKADLPGNADDVKGIPKKSHIPEHSTQKRKVSSEEDSSIALIQAPPKRLPSDQSEGTSQQQDAGVGIPAHREHVASAHAMLSGGSYSSKSSTDEESLSSKPEDRRTKQMKTSSQGLERKAIGETRKADIQSEGEKIKADQHAEEAKPKVTDLSNQECDKSKVGSTNNDKAGKSKSSSIQHVSDGATSDDDAKYPSTLTKDVEVSIHYYCCSGSVTFHLA